MEKLPWILRSDILRFFMRLISMNSAQISNSFEIDECVWEMAGRLEGIRLTGNGKRRLDEPVQWGDGLGQAKREEE